MSWRGGIKRDKTDAVFSLLVRERANFRCEYCGKDYRHSPKTLHCSHVYGRRSAGTRWHPLNAVSHCFKCHGYLGENPTVFAEHIKRLIGERNYDLLTQLANKPTKFSKFDKEIIHKHLLSEKKRMLKERANGNQKRIDFTMYPP